MVRLFVGLMDLSVIPRGLIELLNQHTDLASVLLSAVETGVVATCD